MQKISRYWSSSVMWKEYFGNKLFPRACSKRIYSKYRKANDVNSNLPGLNIKEDGPSKIPTYKDAVKKEASNEEYVDKKIKERLDSIIPQLKKDIKEEVWQEVKHEIKKNFDAIKKDYEENIKKDYDSKMNIPISGDDMLDIRGHGQEQEY